MLYTSTRGGAGQLTFPDVMLAGLASDGGLFVPDRWPVVSFEPGTAYESILATMLLPYVGGFLDEGRLLRLATEAVSAFPQGVVPIREIEDETFLMELFWGPSLSFKDLGLQVVARLFEAVGKPVTVVGATSGDTGAAAIDAFRGRANVAVVILHPEGRISEVQRRQMTTVPEENVLNISVEGTFDDCQYLIKELLADAELGPALATANSINWFRIAAQTAYYAHAASRLEGPIDVSVPSGNFGNAFSAYTATRMGCRIDRIVVATNMNRGLADLLTTGTLEVRKAIPTMSPAMDIQVPSNLERALFEALGRDSSAVVQAMEMIETRAQLYLMGEALERLRSTYRGESVTEAETSQTMRDHHRLTGTLIDPHTAVALAGARRASREGTPMVVVATAHPAKFPDAVARATGVLPALPEDLEGIYELPERLVRVRCDYHTVRRLVVDAMPAG